MGNPVKQGKRKREPEWHEILNGQVWEFRRTATKVKWILVVGFAVLVAVLVGLEVWRVLR